MPSLSKSASICISWGLSIESIQEANLLHGDENVGLLGPVFGNCNAFPSVGFGGEGGPLSLSVLLVGGSGVEVWHRQEEQFSYISLGGCAQPQGNSVLGQ